MAVAEHSGDLSLVTNALVRVIASITLPDGRAYGRTKFRTYELLGFEQAIALFRWPGDQPFPADGEALRISASHGQARSRTA